jgi:hypothetical protein
VATTTAEFNPVLKDLPRVRVAAGATLRLLVVAADEFHCAGVDLESGALVRTWCAQAATERLRRLDVVEVTLDDDVDAIPDPAQPEAVALAAPAQRGRACERLLRPLLHPQGQPLLGISATAIPFWQRSGDHPSIALVEPDGRILLRREGSYLSCAFPWQGHQRELPCLDRALAGHMDRKGRTRMTAGKGTRLVVALTPPLEGRCHKVVETVLPRS